MKNLAIFTKQEKIDNQKVVYSVKKYFIIGRKHTKPKHFVF